MANFFDQFDEPAPAPAAAAMPAGPNFFDQFDAPPPTQPNPSTLAAIGRGLTQGVTFGYGDELTGAIEGAGSWLRGNGYQDAYERARDASRANDRAAEQAHPWAMTGGKIAGNVVGTVPMVALAPAAFGAAPAMGAAARVVGGVGSGAVLGGVQGVGEGTGSFSEQVLDGVAGAKMGGVFGLGGAALGAGLGKVAPLVRDAVGPRLPGFGRPASRELVEAYEASGPAQVRETLDKFGPEAMLVDAGTPFLGRAQGIAAQPDGPGQRIVAGLMKRNEGTNARLAADLDGAFGPALNPETVEAGFQGIRDRAGQAYGRATAEAGVVDTTDALARLAQRLGTAEGAEKAALLRARDMLMTRGQDGRLVPQTDARNLHAIKNELDGLITYGDPTIGARPGSLGRTDGALVGVRGALNDVLERQVPGYREANLSARTAHGASEGLESGKRVLDGGESAIRPDSFARAYEAAPLEQQAALRTGVRSDLDRIVGTKANDLQALRQQVMGEGDWNRAKLATVFGDDEAARVWNATDRETAFRDAYNRVVNGSNTAKIQEGVKATGIRSASPGANSQDLAIGAALGGQAGAATAAAVKGGRYAWNVIGRASDRKRNEQVGEALALTGPELAAIVGHMDTTIAGRVLPEAAQLQAYRMGQMLVPPLDRESDNRERAKAFGRYVLQHR